MLDEQKLISYKQNFTGQSFQWIKTDRPELLGKVVKCRDIQILGTLLMAVFDDGSKIDASKVTSNMMMISQDMPALSIAEVNSIYGPKKPLVPKVNSPEENRKPSTTTPIISNLNTVSPSLSETKRSNMFEMFNSDTSIITLNISARLPDKKLLKLMYTSAEDKEKFLSELTEYVHNLINKQVVRDSINQILVPAASIKKEKSEPGTIKLTELNNGSK